MYLDTVLCRVKIEDRGAVHSRNHMLVQSLIILLDESLVAIRSEKWHPVFLIE
jgi:hypothetical protein